MAILQSCCYWKTVRKGSFASAFYTLIYFGFSTLILLIYVNDEKDFLTGKRKQPRGESMLERGDLTTATVIFNILFLCCSVFLVISSILVIVGLRNNKRELLLPWIVFMLCDVLIELAHLVYLTTTQRVIFDPIVGFIFTLDFFVMCLNSYCLLCIISQYQEYRQGVGNHAGEITNEVILSVSACETGFNATCPKGEQYVPKRRVHPEQFNNISPVMEEMEETEKALLSRDNEKYLIEMCDPLESIKLHHQSQIPTITLEPSSSK